MTKRIIIATLTGVLMGIFCWQGGVILGLLENPPEIHIANIIAHRALMGFVIGISALRMNWAAHGIIVGSVVGSVFTLFDAYVGMPTWVLWGMLLPGNAAYGLIIEFVTTKLFRAPVK
jgi:hypothetical protein